MDTHITKAEASLLLPQARSFDAERVAAIRQSAVRARDAAVGNAIWGGLAWIADLLMAWPRRQRLLAELNTLSDRELADIGLNRGDLANVVDGGLTRQAPSPAHRAVRTPARTSACAA